MVLLNETFTSTQRSTAVILLKRLLREIAHKQCRGGLVTHFYEVGDGLESEGFFSLITEVEGEGEYKERPVSGLEWHLPLPPVFICTGRWTERLCVGRMRLSWSQRDIFSGM